MANIAFKGIKQVTASYFAGLTDSQKMCYLWFVNDSAKNIRKIYLGTREYGVSGDQIYNAIGDFLTGSTSGTSVKQYIDNAITASTITAYTETVQATATNNSTDYLGFSATPNTPTSGAVTVDYTISAKTVDVSGATGTTKGLAKAEDVKVYVDEAIAGLGTPLTGATFATQNYITGSTTNKNLTIGAKTVDIEDATSSNTGMADAYDVKQYVDSAVTITGITEGNYITASTSNKNVTIGAKKVAVSGATATGQGLADAYDAKVTFATAATPSTGYLKTYTISQGGQELGKIDIPKDLVVSGGSIVTGTWSGGTFTPSPTGTDKALELDLANVSTPIYINVADLVDAYTEGNGIDISNTNVISAVVDSSNANGLGVGANGLSMALSNAGNAGTVKSITLNGTANNFTNGTIDLGTVITGETQLSLETGGTGNAITSLSVDGHEITINSGKTFITGATTSGTGNFLSGVSINGETLTFAKGTALTSHATHAINVSNGTATAAGSQTITYVESVASGGTATSGNPQITTTRKTVTIPTIPDLTTGTTTGSGNVVTDIAVSGHQISLTKNISVADGAQVNVLESVSGKTTTTDYITATTGAIDANKKQTITIDAKTVAVSGATGSTKGLAAAEDVKTYVDTAVGGALTGVTAGSGITVSAVSSQTQTINVKPETMTEALAEQGHIEIQFNSNQEIFGLMYITGNDVEGASNA